MVKVLAASPQRWKRIYSASRRPPPDYFFSELGEGGKQVEHIEADFLAKPTELAKTLKQMTSIDYVFFFSYMQPKQKGNVLGMWSNADELAKVNTELLTNLLEALKIADLRPKRVLLQTGAKQYGFHIGPATSPSFENDPRVMLENNFYYPQDDALQQYCRDTGTHWNVVRPSYIIGAVRDNLLNHLVGLSAYCAVQAHLGQPIAFPGDYIAWDREYCQSSGLLNAYLEEWAVLNPATANEAFNVQDGLNFTWGRLWPYLGAWYGAQWAPPEVDESKYQTFKSRWGETPRG
jgi:nucleoside-diphosphate-sugar epimerase